MKRIVLIVMAVLMITGVVQADDRLDSLIAKVQEATAYNNRMTQVIPDIHGTILKPFDVSTGTENDMDYLNIESKHGTWLMDVEAGVRYMNTRAFVGYETTTKIDRKEAIGIEYFITPNISARIQHTKHTLYGHGPVRTRYVAGGIGFSY